MGNWERDNILNVNKNIQLKKSLKNSIHSMNFVTVSSLCLSLSLCHSVSVSVCVSLSLFVNGGGAGAGHCVPVLCVFFRVDSLLYHVNPQLEFR